MTKPDETESPWPKLYTVKAGMAEGHGRLNVDQYEEPEYTVSDAPHINGWNCDGGYPGYGLSKEWAERIVLAVNSHARLVEALRFYAKAQVTNATPGRGVSNCDDGAYARAALQSLKMTGED